MLGQMPAEPWDSGNIVGDEFVIEWCIRVAEDIQYNQQSNSLPVVPACVGEFRVFPEIDRVYKSVWY